MCVILTMNYLASVMWIVILGENSNAHMHAHLYMHPSVGQNYTYCTSHSGRFSINLRTKKKLLLDPSSLGILHRALRSSKSRRNLLNSV